MKLRPNSKYSLLVATSMGVRITPISGQPVASSENFLMHASSAETNVASISSYLGLSVKVLTKFVKDNPVATKIKRDLRARFMDFEGIEIPQDTPWGYRHQINIADSGYGTRGPRVLNARAGEVGQTISEDDFNLERIFVKEGAQVIHLSGLIAALSSKTGTFCLNLVKKAKQNGTLVSFDLNYRKSFWENREKELREIFHEIAAHSDILVGNEEDFQLCLGIRGPEEGGENLSAKIDAFKEMIDRTKQIYKGTKVFATTLREVKNTNAHLWGGIMEYDSNWHIVKPREIQVLDRIGGGDGFVGGLLYGILKGWEAEKWIQFGWASGALATSFITDYAQPADEEQIWSVWQGNARVKR